MRVWKADYEWEDAVGYWNCGDCSDLANGSNAWEHPARILGVSPAALVKLLHDEYHAVLSHNSDCSLVIIRFKAQAEMRRWKNYINGQSRKNNYII